MTVIFWYDWLQQPVIQTI